MLSRVVRGRLVQRFTQTVLTGARYGITQASRTMGIISPLPNSVSFLRVFPVYQSRFFSETTTVNCFSFPEKLDRVSSFETAVELINVRLRRFDDS